VRVCHLTKKGRAALDEVTPEDAPAVIRTIASLLDPRVPLVRPEDLGVEHGSSIMARAVPGTGLVVCFIPLGDEVFLVNVRRAT
jgi:hypothetical protein